MTVRAKQRDDGKLLLYEGTGDHTEQTWIASDLTIDVEASR